MGGGFEYTTAFAPAAEYVANEGVGNSQILGNLTVAYAIHGKQPSYVGQSVYIFWLYQFHFLTYPISRNTKYYCFCQSIIICLTPIFLNFCPLKQVLFVCYCYYYKLLFAPPLCFCATFLPHLFQVGVRQIGIKMDLSDRLKNARESIAYTQKEMAKAVSVSVQMWQAYESGKSVPGGNVFEALARMGFNVNWLLTGDGPRGFSKEDSNKLQLKEAYESLKESIARQRESRKLDKFLQNATQEGRLTSEQFDAYLNDSYIPTKKQLISLCEMAGAPFSYDEFKNIVTREKYKPTKSFALDENLLKLAVEVVEDIKYADGPGLPSTKATLINLVYSMNSEANYTKDRLKRFLGAVCTLINQGIDIEKLSERKLNNLIFEIAHHTVKGGDD